MIIKIRKFGTLLNGRPAGREAALVLKQLLREKKKDEELVLDFSKVNVLTPSYADEFLRDIQSTNYTIKVINASPLIKDTLAAIDYHMEKTK